MKTIKRRFVGFFIVTCLSLLFLGVPVFADEYGLDATASAAKLGTQNTVPTIAGNVIGTALSMIGVIFFILMIYGGFLWMTARGNEDQTKKAFDTIVAAVAGMIVVLASYALTNFVFNSITKSVP